MIPAAPPSAGLSPAEKRALLAGLLRKRARAVDSVYPLSDNQQGIWFLCQFAPESSIYNVSFAARIHSALDVPGFRRAFQALVDRHPSLRTTITVQSGIPVQHVHERPPVHFEQVDAAAWPEAELQTRLVAETQRRFDLERGPVMRVSLFTRSAQEHILVLVIHHIVVDFWSLAVIMNELGVLYAAEKAGRPAALPPLAAHYADFVRWQTDMLAGPAGERLWDYWKTQLAGPLPVLHLPTDRPRPPIQMFRGAQHDFTLDDELARRLRALAKAEGATLYMMLLAAFDLMLYSHSGQEDILVASPMVGRSKAEFEGLVGFFANPVVLRANLSGNPTFRAFLGQVRQTVLGALEHQDYPTLRLVQRLRPPRDLSRSPLCQTMFVLDKPHRITEQVGPSFARGETGLRMDLDGFVMESIPLERRAATLDLVMLIIETTGSLSASIRFNTDLFDAATISRMAGHFQVLLESVLRDPMARIGELEILTGAERRQLLVEFNDTQTEYPKDRCIHERFEEQVRRTPDNVAVECEGQQLTYVQLNARANQLAHHLQSLGVGPEVPVGLCVERSIEMLVAMVAIHKAGGAYVPLDPAYPAEWLAFVLADCQMPVLLTQSKLVARLPQHSAQVVCLDALPADSHPSEAIRNSRATDLACVLYTSGSTGKPNGVQVSHQAVVNFLTSMRREPGLTANDVVVAVTTLSFDIAGLELWLPLTTGARVVVASREVATDGVRLAELLKDCGATLLQATPATWQMLLASGWQGDRLLKSLCGGETLPAELADALLRRCGSLWNMYGPTETTMWSAVQRVTAGQPVRIGRPIANTIFYVVGRHRRLVPLGVPGELWIGGAGVARGYLNRPKLTAEKFIADPFRPGSGQRVYRTGDLVRYGTDGTLEFIGRQDHQVKIRGFRIELGEIEAVLGQHPAVREAVVLNREDAPGDQRLVAYAVADTTADELRRFLKNKLPDHMVPAVVVLLTALPVAPNGKVDRRALPAPDRSRPELEKEFVAPRDDLERQLAQIWEEVLGIKPVGVTDNFFELGGHSLLAVRLFALIENRLGKKLPLTAIFQGATVEHLADLLRQQARSASQSSLVPIQPGGSKPPLFLVHPAGGHVFSYIHLAQLLGPDQPCYGLQSKGLEDGHDPHTRIEDMAAWYIRALQSVQPTGPYMLGGWSMGGIVAFEMAQQLHAVGQRVALLALFDGRIPTADESFPEDNAEAIGLAERYFGISFGPIDSLGELPKDQQLASMLEQAKIAGLVPAELEISQASRFAELLRSDLRAAQSYILRLYPGRITFFKANETPACMSPISTLGWSKLASGGVELHVVPGNHVNLMYEPHVAVLAQKLTACLNQAQFT